VTFDEPSCEVILEQADGPAAAAYEPTGAKMPVKKGMANDIMIDPRYVVTYKRQGIELNASKGMAGPANK
jgi:hypothetical protein